MKLGLAILCVIFLNACANSPQSNYRPAKGNQSGYTEIALNSTTYRVQFIARGNQRVAAQNYALQRAAELTLNAGYDWFIVSQQKSRFINTAKEENTSRLDAISKRHCGLLVCEPRTQPIPEMDTAAEETYTLVFIDIHMGRGIRPEKNSYSAQETWARLAIKK